MTLKKNAGEGAVGKEGQGPASAENLNAGHVFGVATDAGLNDAVTTILENKKMLQVGNDLCVFEWME
jgi:methyl coenzyme M reductase beta subunit